MCIFVVNMNSWKSCSFNVNYTHFLLFLKKILITEKQLNIYRSDKWITINFDVIQCKNNACWWQSFAANCDT